MNRKLILALPLLVVTMLALSASAQAACPHDEPDCDPGGDPPPTIKTLHVADSSQATLTGTGINCGVAGDDCLQSYTYEFGEEPPSVTLTATGVPAGYTAGIYRCTTTTGSTCFGPESQCGPGSCSLVMSSNYRVRLSVADETPPTTATVSGPAKTGPSVRHFTASASDGAGVVSYRYYLDGVDQGLFSPGAGYDVPTSLSEGDHTLTARGRDAAGNESLAPSPGKAFTVDKSTGLINVTTPPPNAQTVSQIAFTPPADAASVLCRTRLGGDEKGSTASCGSPYTPQATTTDGAYTVELVVTDDVGNTATISRSFTLDRGAPNLTVSSPAGGAIVGGPFTPEIDASDGFTPEGQIDVSCKLDNGAYGSCDALAPADGARKLTVRATDLAGNSSESVVDFTYDATAPVVKITTGPAEGSVVYVRSASFAFTASDLTAVTRSCKLDGGAFGPCTSATGHQLSGLGLGIHTFTLRAVDAAGHVTTVQRRFTVANKPTDTGTTTAPPPAPPVIVTTPLTELAKQIVNTTISTRTDAFRKYTIFNRLTLKGVPAGAKVTVTCKGKKCPAKRFSSTHKGALKLKKFTKKKLRPGTKLTIRVTKDGVIGKQFVLTIRKGKSPRLKITQIA